MPSPTSMSIMYTIILLELELSSSVVDRYVGHNFFTCVDWSLFSFIQTRCCACGKNFPIKNIRAWQKYGKHHRLNGNNCYNCPLKPVDHPHHRHCVRVLVFEFWNKQRWKTMQVWQGKCYRRPRATALCASTGPWSTVAFSYQVCALFLYLSLKTKVFLIHCTLYFTGNSSASPFFCQVCARTLSLFWQVALV